MVYFLLILVKNYRMLIIRYLSFIPLLTSISGFAQQLIDHNFDCLLKKRLSQVMN